MSAAKISFGMQGRTLLERVLGVDLRSLAALRIGLAIILLIDLVIRAQSLVSHYTDVGVLPRPARITTLDLRPDSTTQLWWSLHMASGSAWFQALLFGVAAALALAMLFGLRTRAATIGSWIILVSLHSRLPWVLQGGDVLLRMLLFWAMFLPLGARWSVDGQRTAQPPKHVDNRHNQSSVRTHWFTSAATAAIVLQIAMMYLFNAAAKTDASWTTDHTALYYALNYDLYATRFGHALLAYPALLRAMTFGAFWLEWLGPLAMFSPLATGRVRGVLAIVFWTFHLGIAATLNVGLFPYVAMVAWLIVLPSGFWNAIEGRLARSPSSWKRLEIPWPRLLANTNDPLWRLSKPGSALVLLLLGYIVTWNVLLLARNQTADWPSWFDVPAQLLRLEQQWTMFAPGPTREDGWFIIGGTLADGSTVNLWRPGQPLPLEKPQYISGEFPDHRWRKYLLNLRNQGDPELLSCFSDWLRWRWDTTEAHGSPQRMVRTVEVSFVLELTPPPGAKQSPLEIERLWTWNYELGRPLDGGEPRVAPPR